MKNFVRCFLSLCTVFLTSCSTHTIETSGNGTHASACKIKNASMTSVNNVAVPKLNIKKINENLLGVWMKFQVTQALNVPLKNPEIIIKMYKNKKIKEEIRLKGVGQRSDEVLWEVYREKNNLPSPVTRDDNLSGVSREDVYPSDTHYANFQYPGVDQAVSFSLSFEDFNKILSAEEIEILIQTHSDPLIAALDRDQLKALLEFKRTCFSD